jgi:hypothetical protein
MMHPLENDRAWWLIFAAATALMIAIDAMLIAALIAG